MMDSTATTSTMIAYGGERDTPDSHRPKAVPCTFATGGMTYTPDYAEDTFRTVIA